MLWVTEVYVGVVALGLQACDGMTKAPAVLEIRLHAGSRI